MPQEKQTIAFCLRFCVVFATWLTASCTAPPDRNASTRSYNDVDQALHIEIVGVADRQLRPTLTLLIANQSDLRIGVSRYTLMSLARGVVLQTESGWDHAFEIDRSYLVTPLPPNEDWLWIDPATKVDYETPLGPGTKFSLDLVKVIETGTTSVTMSFSDSAIYYKISASGPVHTIIPGWTGSVAIRDETKVRHAK